MATTISAGIHFDKADVWHRYNPGDGVVNPYGVLKFGRQNDGNVFFQSPEQIDAVIAELVALKQEMDPPPAWCPAVTVLDDGDETVLYCDRDHGHPGSHHAPGPDEGSEVAWGDEPERVPDPTGLCGHTVAPGAWSQGFALCRECLSIEQLPLYDRAAAGEQLPKATVR